MTEVAAPICGNQLEDNVPGTVGKPLSGVSLKLDDNGELLVRGPSVMQGYWNQPDATAKVIDQDGWLRTGDLAELRDGRVIIRGRTNETLVLSTGNKVDPIGLEMAIGLDPLFDQVMIIGNGMPSLTALLVLNKDAWPAFATAQGVDSDGADSLADDRIVQPILGRLERRLHAYPRYAQVRAAQLTLTPWTIEDGLLTTTMKLRRDRIAARFGSQLLP